MHVKMYGSYFAIAFGKRYFEYALLFWNAKEYCPALSSFHGKTPFSQVSI
jgi:hypothetical protein